MAESSWEMGKLTPVWHQVGVRADGGRRYRRASFDLLQWQSPGASREELFIVPVSNQRIDAQDLNLKETGQTGMEFGYYGLAHLVVEPHEADGGSDTWKALHGFGPV